MAAFCSGPGTASESRSGAGRSGPPPEAIDSSPYGERNTRVRNRTRTPRRPRRGLGPASSSGPRWSPHRISRRRGGPPSEAKGTSPPLRRRRERERVDIHAGSPRVCIRRRPAPSATQFAGYAAREAAITLWRRPPDRVDHRHSAARLGTGAEPVWIDPRRRSRSPVTVLRLQRESLASTHSTGRPARWADRKKDRTSVRPSIISSSCWSPSSGSIQYRFRTLCRDGRRVPMIDLYPEVAAGVIAASRRGDPANCVAGRGGRRRIQTRGDRVDVYAFSLARRRRRRRGSFWPRSGGASARPRDPMGALTGVRRRRPGPESSPRPSWRSPSGSSTRVFRSP